MEQLLADLIKSGYPNMALAIFEKALLLGFIIIIFKLLNERYYFKKAFEKDDVDFRVTYKKNKKVLTRVEKDKTKKSKLKKGDGGQSKLWIVHNTKKPLL